MLGFCIVSFLHLPLPQEYIHLFQNEFKIFGFEITSCHS